MTNKALVEFYARGRKAPEGVDQADFTKNIEATVTFGVQSFSGAWKWRFRTICYDVVGDNAYSQELPDDFDGLISGRREDCNLPLHFFEKEDFDRRFPKTDMQSYDARYYSIYFDKTTAKHMIAFASRLQTGKIAQLFYLTKPTTDCSTIPDKLLPGVHAYIEPLFYPAGTRERWSAEQLKVTTLTQMKQIDRMSWAHGDHFVTEGEISQESPGYFWT